MTQYSYNLILNDGETLLIKYLLDKHIKKCQKKKKPVGTFAHKLHEKLLVIQIN